MLKKTMVLVMLLCMMFTSLPAWAVTSDELKTFGFTDERNRDTTVNGGAFLSVLYHDGGPSYSQPLILKGDRWGGELSGKMVTVTVEGNNLNGYVLPPKSLEIVKQAQLIEPVWSVKLSGDIPSKSHPTFVEKNGKKYIYIGTYSKYFDIVDITNFMNTKQVNVVSKESPNATDITSAPLVLDWNGHDIVVTTSGNTGKVYILTDPLTDNINGFYINAGSGRTSSSPAPVDGGKGFAIGIDQGQSRGELQIYYLDDILDEDAKGKVIQKSTNARVVEVLPSGLCASFSVDGDGDMLYFGDCQSRIYAYNTATKTPVWMNEGNKGIFSNRSPALTSTRVYVPAVGKPGEEGKVLSIDRVSGNTLWSVPMSYNNQSLGRAQTAPTIMRAPGIPVVLEGSSEGYMTLIDPVSGKVIRVVNTVKYLQEQGLNKYASGVSGEISALGDYAVTATENGVVIWVLMDLNLKAVSIDSGVPEGTKVEPGTELTGKVTFKNESIYSFLDIPVAVLHNNWPATLIDENGVELPWININGKQVQVADFQPGQERTFTFKYHPPEVAKTHLEGLINHEKISVVMDENTFEDNIVSTVVPVNYQNLKVVILDYSKEAIPGDPVQVSARVFNEGGEKIITRLVWYLNGSVIKDIPNFDIISQQDTAVNFNMPSSDATVTVKVNPDYDRPANEKDKNDNIASCTIIKKSIPQKSNNGLNVSIKPPSFVQGIHSFNFNVTVSGYFSPPPPPAGPSSVNVYLNISGNSKKATGYKFTNGTWGDILQDGVIDVKPSFSKSFKVMEGEKFSKTFTFTFPACGYCGVDTYAIIEAKASGGGESGKDVKKVLIKGYPVKGFGVQLTK